VHRYLVVGSNHDSRLVSLRDPVGGLHVALCTQDVPEVGAVMRGATAAVGFALMIGPADKVFRLIFREVECSDESALRTLRPIHVPVEFVMANARGGAATGAAA
jgi:hypothetical protein